MTSVPARTPQYGLPSLDRALQWGPIGAIILGALSVLNWIVSDVAVHSSYWFAVTAIVVPLAGSLILGSWTPPFGAPGGRSASR